MRRIPAMGRMTWIPLVVLALVIAGCAGGQQGTNPAAPAAGEGEAAPAPTQAPTQAPAEAPASTPAPARPKSSAYTETSTPAPAPEPRTQVVTVPAGTQMEVVFLDTVGSAVSQVGDTFRARVTQDVVQDGIVAIPAGTVVTGTVTEAVSTKKIGGQAKLGLSFTSLELTSGRSAPIQASFYAEGKSETKRDAATIGGATAGGAVLGRILGKGDKGKKTALGALVGAAVGTAIASKTQGEEVEIAEGTAIPLQLTAPTQITVRP